MREVRIHPQAADEAEQAVAWYENERSGLGGEFASAIDAALDLMEWSEIPSVPAAGQAGKLGVRRLILKRFPYDVVFIASAHDIWVIAFAHHSRRPAFWTSRLKV